MFFKKKKVELPPEWLIVGLGNPGPEYRGTRHNVGFMVVDELSKRLHILVKSSKHQSLYGTGLMDSRPVALAKPLTYMNLSGRAVSALARQWGIKPNRILIIADELSLPLGKVRLRLEGSAGGHNGHKSIIQALATQEYARVKVGIGSADNGDAIDHVLGSWRPEERPIIERAVQIASTAIEEFIGRGVEAAQSTIERGNKG